MCTLAFSVTSFIQFAFVLRFYWPPNYDSDLFLYTYICQYLWGVFNLCRFVELSRNYAHLGWFIGALKGRLILKNAYSIFVLWLWVKWFFKSTLGTLDNYSINFTQQSWRHLDSMTLSGFQTFLFNSFILIDNSICHIIVMVNFTQSVNDKFLIL